MKEKRMFCAGTVVLAVIMGLVVVNFIRTDHKSLESNGDVVGSLFYETFYSEYDFAFMSEEERTEFLKAYETNGITLSLSSIKFNYKLSEDALESIEILEKEFGCDPDTTLVNVTPNHPYGKKDYDVKIKSKCNPIKL